MIKSEQTSTNNLRNTVLLAVLGVIVLSLIIAFVWHYLTAKPPESDLHTRPAATWKVRPGGELTATIAQADIISAG